MPTWPWTSFCMCCSRLGCYIALSTYSKALVLHCSSRLIICACWSQHVGASCLLLTVSPSCHMVAPGLRVKHPASSRVGILCTLLGSSFEIALRISCTHSFGTTRAMCIACLWQGALQVSDEELLMGMAECKKLGALPMVRVYVCCVRV